MKEKTINGKLCVGVVLEDMRRLLGPSTKDNPRPVCGLCPNILTARAAHERGDPSACATCEGGYVYAEKTAYVSLILES